MLERKEKVVDDDPNQVGANSNIKMMKTQKILGNQSKMLKTTAMLTQRMVRNSWRLGLFETREEFLIGNLRRQPRWKVHFLHQCRLGSRHSQSMW
jgi:hypothetical protein